MELYRRARGAPA